VIFNIISIFSRFFIYPAMFPSQRTPMMFFATFVDDFFKTKL